MYAVNFDTLNYSRILQDAGIPQSQADAFTNAQKAALREILPIQELASKRDLQESNIALNANIEKVRTELKAEIQEVRSDIEKVSDNFKIELAKTERDILKWVVTTMVAQTALIVAVIGLAVVYLSK